MKNRSLGSMLPKSNAFSIFSEKMLSKTTLWGVKLNNETFFCTWLQVSCFSAKLNELGALLFGPCKVLQCFLQMWLYSYLDLRATAASGTHSLSLWLSSFEKWTEERM